MFSKATLKERRQYYREEWSEKDLPDFIKEGIKSVSLVLTITEEGLTIDIKLSEELSL